MIETMFSIPLVQYSLDNWAERKQGFLDLMSEFRMITGNETVASSYTVDVTVSDMMDRRRAVDEMTKLLRPEMSRFGHEFGCDPVMVHSWFERASTQMYHPPHTHGHGGWSAVLYIDFDPLVHNSTIFVSPFNHFIEGTQLQYRTGVKEGDLVLFPSFLLHYTQPNESDKKRTVASFNMSVNSDNIPESWVLTGDKNNDIVKRKRNSIGGDLDAFG